MNKNFINADLFWHDRVRDFLVDFSDLYDAPEFGAYALHDDNFPFKLEKHLKARGIVPENAALLGCWFPPEVRGVELRFSHPSFNITRPGACVERTLVDLLNRHGVR